MILSHPAARMAAGCLLLTLFFVPFSAGQTPTLPIDNPAESVVGFAVITPQSFAEVKYLGNVVLPLIVHDLSRDSGTANEAPGGGTAFSPSGHSTALTIKEIRPANALGWQVLLGSPFVQSIGGEVVETTVLISTSPLLNVQEISVDIEAVFTGPGGETRNQTVTLNAQVERYDTALARITNPQIRAGQFESVRYQVMVSNDGVYPDTYQFIVGTDKDEFRVLSPPNLYVPAKETRYTNITILTPKDKVYELGQTAVVTVKVQSLTGTGVYSTVGVLQVRGPYIPTYWIPVIIVGLISAVVVTRNRRLEAGLRKLEKGRPRRVQPTARQTVLLAELKRRDPEAYAKRKAQLDAIYAARRDAYRDGKKTRRDRERKEHEAAVAELRADKQRLKAKAREQKRAVKLERSADKKQRKADRKAAKVQAKLDKKQAKLDKKAEKKRDKEIGKKRKELEKQKVKLEKTQAKAEKAEAKLARAAARAEKKRAKSR